MGSSQGKKNNQQLNDFSSRDNTVSNEELNYDRGQRDQDNNHSGSAFDSAFSGYGDMQTGGLSAADQERLRGAAANSGGMSGAMYGGMYDMYAGMANGSGMDMERLRASEPVWRDMMENGGFDDAVRGRLGGDIAGLRTLAKDGGIDETSANLFRGDGGFKKMADTGGMDDETRSRIRGAGYFDEFAKTGGLEDRDKSLIRDRITSAIPATYDALQRSIATNNRVVGNAGPGSNALTARLGRDSSREIAAVNRDAELSLLDRIMEGRKWGATNISSAEKDLTDRDVANRKWGTEGMATAENAMQQLRTGNMFRGNEGAFDREFGLTNTIANNRMAGADGYNNMERYNTELGISERDKGLAGMGSAAGGAGAAGRANLDNEWDMINFQNSNKRYGTEGMTGLYGAANTSGQQRSDRILDSRSVDANSNLNTVQMRHQNNPSVMNSLGTALNYGSQIAGGVGGIMSAYGGVGGRTKRTTGVAN